MATSAQPIVRQALAARVRAVHGIDLADVTLEFPPSLELGDLACPVAFDLARSLKRSPRAIAASLVEGMPPIPGVSRLEIAGAGYINVFLDRAATAAVLVADLRPSAESRAGGEKVIVEHTNINPNKAAHIGHLRNAVLGDTLVRLLRRAGRHVEVQNYIDDTGVQVADLVVGFVHLRHVKSVEEVDHLVARDGRPIDHACWDLYAEVGAFYEQDPQRRALRARTLKMMEEGEGLEAELARHLAPRIVQRHLLTMARLGVTYDLLPWESHIIGLHFWARTFELLKHSKAIRYMEEGERKGCWIMDLPGEGDAAAEEAKIIVRSNGTVTYVGKDIAYQLWKLGLLGTDFRYRRFDSGGAGEVWSTCVEGGESPHPDFGAAHSVYNVIDVRQSYPQRVVQQGLRALGHTGPADRSHHFAYEMVALSASCAKELGYTSGEDEAGKHVEMSGRRGYGVKADDLLDALEEHARREVLERTPDAGEAAGEIARRVSVAALRYFMLKYTRNKIIAFDFKEALSFEGETGPYILYSVVRARNIFNKMAERERFDPARVPEMAAGVDFSFLDKGPVDDHWELLGLLVRFDDMVEQAIRTLEPSSVARYAFTLAQRFNHFYHQYPVMQEPDPNLKAARVLLTWLFLQYQTKALDLMGIEAPARM